MLVCVSTFIEDSVSLRYPPVSVSSLFLRGIVSPVHGAYIFLLDRQSANPIDHLVFVTYSAGIIGMCENSHSLLCVCWE